MSKVVQITTTEVRTTRTFTIEEVQWMLLNHLGILDKVNETTFDWEVNWNETKGVQILTVEKFHEPPLD